MMIAEGFFDNFLPKKNNCLMELHSFALNNIRVLPHRIRIFNMLIENGLNS